MPESAHDDEDRKGDRKVRGRGGNNMPMDEDDRYEGRGGVFEALPPSKDDGTSGPARSIEGWVVIVREVHNEAQEDDVIEAFGEYGSIKNMHLNLDRRTGFVKGYAFIEFESRREAESAIKGMNMKKLLDQTVQVDWAFSRTEKKSKRKGVTRD
eukprot:gnl/MRDRNA2_/MRDRNA2_99166_c0_seq1.p1 gnl/MRDRNA2_/MRDRNA2_99166_c0~~gnl/MRDRNA2_/MRDRNA2_99166_c0_seq1.p1  ORF type:complete len:154 (-),score=40.99 gnl/MRDRNA2_/MRDRNA2_99166_c0_seq1:19-480(-)